MTAAADGRSGELVAARRAGTQAPGLLARLRRDALQALAAGALYRHTLIGRVPSDLKFRIALRWPGDARRGAAIIGGEIELAGEVVRTPSPRWAPRAKHCAISCKVGLPRTPDGTASRGGPMCSRCGSLPGWRISMKSPSATR